MWDSKVKIEKPAQLNSPPLSPELAFEKTSQPEKNSIPFAKVQIHYVLAMGPCECRLTLQHTSASLALQHCDKICYHYNFYMQLMRTFGKEWGPY